ncbi:MAG: methyltransferase domain-containing protein [Alphaproteobacteria bacterium]|nr:methyltransferase domain-containing protein [Alphaproteobacteria bacterium]
MIPFGPSSSEEDGPEIPFGVRFKAWWAGEDPRTLIETPEGDEDGEGDDPDREDAEGDESEGEEEGKLPYSIRLKAWWDGYDAEELAQTIREAEEADESDESGETNFSFRVRFLAWWQGKNSEDVAAEPGSDDESLKETLAKKTLPGVASLEFKAEEAAPELTDKNWPAERIKIVETIWGPGFIGPGGSEQVLKLVRPFGMNSSMNVLDLGAGLGGPARAIAEDSKAWLTGMEGSDALAAAGMERSVNAGMSKKAPVNHADFETIELRPNFFDRVFSKEALFTVADKEHLFKMVFTALKNEGQFVFTDYMVRERGAESQAVKDWIEHEPVQPHLWSPDRTEAYLKRLTFDIRVVEDITKAARRRIFEGWQKFIDTHEPGSIPDELVPSLVDEAEHWARRVAALDSGNIRMYRIYALKPKK